MEINTPVRRRRTHTESFKQSVIDACQVPGASLAGGGVGPWRERQSGVALGAGTGCGVAIPASGSESRYPTGFRAGG
jgi:hypothetical protein